MSQSLNFNSTDEVANTMPNPEVQLLVSYEDSDFTPASSALEGGVNSSTVYSGLRGSSLFKEDKKVTIAGHGLRLKTIYEAETPYIGTISILGTNNKFKGSIGSVDLPIKKITIGDATTKTPIRVAFDEDIYAKSIDNASDYPATIFLGSQKSISLVGLHSQNTCDEYVIQTLPAHSENILEHVGTARFFDDVIE